MRSGWQKRAERAGLIAATFWTIASSTGCTAALGSSNSASEGLNSVSSISEGLVDSGSSLASSSSDGAENEALEQDVSTFTALFADSGGDAQAYLRGVGALCERYAISDWEREPTVRRGMARGLARSRLSPREIEDFADHVASGDPALRDSLRAAAAAPR